jgi:predicted GIY-YIG superfamily endonuclease
MAFHVYILQSEKTGRFYVGHTQDVQERLARHNCGAMEARVRSQGGHLRVEHLGLQPREEYARVVATADQAG